MKKIITFCFILFILIFKSAGQSDLTFYHLNDATPQSSMHNPTFFPDAKFYFSLPGLSGLNVKMNNAFSYNQLMVPVEGTDSMKVDINRVLEDLREGDNFKIMGDVSLFQFGLSTGNKAFTLFYNLRYDGAMRYPVQFLNYFVNGNGNFIGERVEENEISGGGIAFSELGVGYVQEFLVWQNRILRAGVRAKYLNGIAYMSAAENASVSMYTDPSTYSLSVVFNDARFRTAGFNELEGDDPTGYLIGFGENANNGFAVDLGAELEINERLSGYLSINDLGFIHWKQDIENYQFVNNDISLNGFDDLEDIDLSQALEDSVDIWSVRDTTTESFRTPIGTRLIMGATYGVLDNGSVSGTFSYNGSAYGASEIGFGVGYTHQFGKTLTLSTSVVKEQSRSLKFGGGFMVRFSVVQLYGSFDNILNAINDPADLQSVDARIGLNFLVGRRKKTDRIKRQPKPKEELSPFPPEYDLDHLVDDDGSDAKN